MRQSVCEQRRGRLASMAPGTVFVFTAAEEALRNRTVAHPYRGDSQMLYLAGFDEPESALVVFADGDGAARAVLYVRPRDAERARWFDEGRGLEGASAWTGIEDVRPIERFGSELVDALAGAAQVGWRVGRSARGDAAMLRAMSEAGERRRRRDDRVPDLVDPARWLGVLRLRKDEGEIEAMRRAGSITAAAFEEIGGALRAGELELGVAGRLEAAFRARGAERTAFQTIVASGPRATCLHAHPTRRALVEGELVLIDAGAEWDGYAADMSRTFSLGAPSAAQAAVLALVQQAHDDAVAAVAPGVALAHIHAVARGTLAAGLVDLGLPGPVDRWAIHATSHWIGLDVHDVGGVGTDEAPTILEPGMVFSIEPGLYIDSDSPDASPALRGIGVRVEDTILTTQGGAEILTRL